MRHLSLRIHVLQAVSIWTCHARSHAHHLASLRVWYTRISALVHLHRLAHGLSRMWDSWTHRLAVSHPGMLHSSSMLVLKSRHHFMSPPKTSLSTIGTNDNRNRQSEACLTQCRVLIRMRLVIFAAMTDHARRVWFRSQGRGDGFLRLPASNPRIKSSTKSPLQRQTIETSSRSYHAARRPPA
jgi:hypothetical protein